MFLVSAKNTRIVFIHPLPLNTDMGNKSNIITKQATIPKSRFKPGQKSQPPKNPRREPSTKLINKL